MINTAEMFEKDKEYAAERCKASGGVSPMFVIHFVRDGKDGITILMADFEDAETKGKSLSIVRLIGAALGAHAISLMAEAWTATQEGPLKKGDLLPAERPDRREVLMVSMTARGEQTRFSAREMLRDAAGAFVDLGPEETQAEGGYDGRMTQLVTPEPLPPWKQQIAIDVLKTMFGIKLDELTQPPTAH